MIRVLLSYLPLHMYKRYEFSCLGHVIDNVLVNPSQSVVGHDAPNYPPIGPVPTNKVQVGEYHENRHIKLP